MVAPSTPAQPAPPARSATDPAAGSGTHRERFARACRCLPVDRPPVWLMRQAGRVLPEYRALKERHSFVEMVRSPELAAEVTLQPIRRFDFDAAILFSDILVIPEALGQAYDFRDGGGVRMAFTLESEADIHRLEVAAVRDRLGYVAEVLSRVRRELDDHTALIGFAGSPWTLACFMMEGGSAREFHRAKHLFLTQRSLFDRLCEKLTAAIIGFLGLQADAGVDALQIFDSLGGTLAPHHYEAASARWIRPIVREFTPDLPMIVFGRGVHDNWNALIDTGASVLGVDWMQGLAAVRRNLPAGVGVQGNLDPAVLLTTPEVVAAETRALLESMRGTTGHIFNLGHGVPPEATLENLQALVGTIRNFR